MREIKFRAWCKPCYQYKKGVMFSWDEVWHDMDMADFDSAGYIFMQFTGLKDKNGREIYDGDILNALCWWWGPCAIKYTQGLVGPCKGDNVMEWRLYNSEKDIHNLWDGKDVEIIGNIYEDPELLKGEDNEHS